MRKIRQEVLQWDIFKDLGALDSSIALAESGLIHLANQGARYLAS
jgi:hypothetical protein